MSLLVEFLKSRRPARVFPLLFPSPRPGFEGSLWVWVLYNSHLRWMWGFKWHLSLQVGWQTEYCWQNGRFQALSWGQETPFWITYSFFLEGWVSQCSAQHPVSWEDCICCLLNSFFGKKSKLSLFFLFVFYFFFFYRVDSQPKSCSRHLSLGPACPICPCICIAMTPWLLFPKHVMLSAQTWPLAPAGLKCSEGVEREMFLRARLLSGHYTLLSFSSFPCPWPNRHRDLHWRTSIITWYIVVVFLNWGMITWYVVPHELDASKKPSFLGKLYFGEWSVRRTVEGTYRLSFILWIHAYWIPTSDKPLNILN